MAFGISSAGFTAKSLADIQQEMGEKIQAAFGVAFKVDLPSSLIAQVIGIVSAGIEECWEILQSVSSLDPDNKEGADLVALCALTGTLPLEPVPSTVLLTLAGSDGTTVTAGHTVSTSIGDKFDTLADVTLAPAALWATSTNYAVGATVRTTVPRTYRCMVAGNSASGGAGPTGTGTAIADDDVVWAYLGDGVAYADVQAESQETGPIVANAFSLTTIETPVSGWANVTNVNDADLGRSLETDAELRLRRVVELAGGGAGTPDAIRAALLDQNNVPGVESVSVFHNILDVTDGDGVLAHSVEALVRGGDEADILATLWAQVGAGIRTVGTNGGDIIDSEGNVQAVNYSRPDEIETYVDLTITYKAVDYPVDGDNQVKAAIAAAIDALPVGHDVFATSLVAAALSVSGVFRVNAITVGTAPSPVGASVTITSRQVATGDTTRVAVTSSAGFP